MVSLNSNSEMQTAICDARVIYGRGQISPVFIYGAVLIAYYSAGHELICIYRGTVHNSLNTHSLSLVEGTVGGVIDCPTVHVGDARQCKSGLPANPADARQASGLYTLTGERVVHLDRWVGRAPWQVSGSCTSTGEWVVHLDRWVGRAPRQVSGSCTSTGEWVVHLDRRVGRAPRQVSGSCTWQVSGSCTVTVDCVSPQIYSIWTLPICMLIYLTKQLLVLFNCFNGSHKKSTLNLSSLCKYKTVHGKHWKLVGYSPGPTLFQLPKYIVASRTVHILDIYTWFTTDITQRNLQK